LPPNVLRNLRLERQEEIFWYLILLQNFDDDINSIKQ
jgi:hypothetical protein